MMPTDLLRTTAAPGLLNTAAPTVAQPTATPTAQPSLGMPSIDVFGGSLFSQSSGWSANLFGGTASPVTPTAPGNPATPTTPAAPGTPTEGAATGTTPAATAPAVTTPGATPATPGSPATPTGLLAQRGTTLADLYQNTLGREADADGLAHWTTQFGDAVDATEHRRFVLEALPELLQTRPEQADQLLGEAFLMAGDRKAVDRWLELARSAGKDVSQVEATIQGLDTRWRSAGILNVQDYGADFDAVRAEGVYQQLLAQQNAIKQANGGQGTVTGATGYGEERNLMATAAFLSQAHGVENLANLDVREVPTTRRKTFTTRDGVWGSYQERPGSHGKKSERPVDFVPATEEELARINEASASTDERRRPFQRDENSFPEVTLEMPGAPRPEVYDKTTGRVIGTLGIAARLGGVGSGNIRVNLGETWAGPGDTYFNLTMMPVTDPATGQQRYVAVPTLGHDGGGWADFASAISPVLSVASFIPGVAPFAMAANAVIQGAQGNWGGALLSAAGAYGSHLSNAASAGANNVLGALEAGNLTAAQAAAAQRAADLSLANNIRSGVQVVGGVNAIANGNTLGGIGAVAGGLSGTSLAQNGGWAGTAGTVAQGAGVANALTNGNTVGGLLGAANMAGVTEVGGVPLRDVATGVNAYQQLTNGSALRGLSLFGRLAQQRGF